MSSRVLIVDDSLTVRMDLAEAFEAAGFSPLLCADAAQARLALEHEAVALVVLDVVLPDADGVDLLKEIRSRPATSTLPILLLSSEADVRDRIRGLVTGADDYVGKPYNLDYVVARGEELVRLRRGRTGPAGVTILVIDDSTTYRETLRQAFERLGHVVLMAGTGEEGLRMAAARRPSAIVVDGVMPGMDGATVIRKVRLDAALRGTPCLLLTASEDDGAELRALDAGADAFVRKEEDIEVVLARLQAMLRSANSERTDGACLSGPKRILAVDDSVTYLQAQAAMLRGEGYEVVLAQSGEEALEMLSVQTVDCILLDLMMPGMGGKETCRRLKESAVTRDLPLIMLTALEDREAMIEGLGSGADDYISKSSEFDVLKARVQAQIRRKQFEDENRRIREELLRSEHEAQAARAARQIAESKAELAEEMKRKNEELEAFSYSVSHDLRSPLRLIEGFCGILLSDYAANLDAEGRAHLTRICAAAERMEELIKDLLELSRVSRAEVRHEQVNLTALALEVKTELERGDPGRAVTFEVQEAMAAQGDSRLLRVLLDNLLGNAWKFTAKTGQARIEVGSEGEGAGTTFFVRDNGAGFDMANAKNLFKPFHRLHGEADFPGTGIGLATVRRIVERHGGRVWAEASLGRGTQVSFRI